MSRLWGTVGGCPFIVKHAKGAYLYDVDGNKYLDYLQAFGPAILGHANPEINEAVMQQMEKVRQLTWPGCISCQHRDEIIGDYT